MALSPNYGFPEPDNSSLVKNGAQDIRALGDAVDTAVWNVGFGQAGKNKIINGDFGIWQRGTSFDFSVSGAYCADRFQWALNGTGATRTISRQTFTPGTAPVAGYESSYFLRCARTVAGSGASFDRLEQLIEDVRTFAGQPVTISCWAKVGSGTADVTLRLRQNFGSGGSASVDKTSGALTLTTSWQRISFTTTLDSVTGKTIGTNSSLQFQFLLPVNTVLTTDIWGVQVEYGSKATPFQTASGGSLQGELAMCQYYFQSFGGVTEQSLASGFAYGTTGLAAVLKFNGQMRSAPTMSIGAGAASDFEVFNATASDIALTALSFQNPSVIGSRCLGTVTAGLVAGNGTELKTVNTTARIWASSEL